MLVDTDWVSVIDLLRASTGLSEFLPKLHWHVRMVNTRCMSENKVRENEVDGAGVMNKHLHNKTTPGLSDKHPSPD